MGSLALVFAIDVLVTAACMFVATKMAFVKAEFKDLLLVVAIVGVVSLIPSIGWLLGLIAFVWLLMQATGSTLLDCVYVVIFTKLVSFVAVLMLGKIFA